MNLNRVTIFWLAVLGIALFIASNTLYIVKETERAILLRFGELVRADIPPGLHFKMPIMHQVRLFNRRILTVDSNPERFLTKEKKFLEVDSFAQWRVYDVSQYYTATNGEVRRAEALLAQRINNGLRNNFGVRTMHEVVSGERDELMEDLTETLGGITKQEFGIELIDIRVKRINLPPDVSESVYNRMNTERQRKAREYRSEGLEQAEGIRAKADRKKIVILSNAYREAEQLRGEGDANATAIYATAYNRSPEFYKFTRSLNAYRIAFKNKSDIMLLAPEGEFFKYIDNLQGKK